MTDLYVFSMEPGNRHTNGKFLFKVGVTSDLSARLRSVGQGVSKVQVSLHRWFCPHQHPLMAKMIERHAKERIAADPWRRVPNFKSKQELFFDDSEDAAVAFVKESMRVVLSKFTPLMAPALALPIAPAAPAPPTLAPDPAPPIAPAPAPPIAPAPAPPIAPAPAPPPTLLSSVADGLARERKRKRHHERGDIPARAVPLAAHPDCDKLRSKLRELSGCADDAIERVIHALRYNRCLTPRESGSSQRIDHYFYADGVHGKMRSVSDVIKTFPELLTAPSPSPG